jgi:hypothetical protein
MLHTDFGSFSCTCPFSYYQTFPISGGQTDRKSMPAWLPFKPVLLNKVALYTYLLELFSALLET